MKGKILGWNFALSRQKLSADGSTTNETLRLEKQRLEARIIEIPVLIARLQNSITLTQNDINWLNGLNNRRRKDWEKENGKNIEQVVYDAANRVVDYKAQVDALTTEKSRIPAQIETINRQLESLVKGESAGLTRGLTAAQAQQLGQLELQKTQEQINHETQMQQIEQQKAQAQADAAAQASKGMNPNLKWGLIIGGSLVAVIVIIYLIKKFKKPPVINPILS